MFAEEFRIICPDGEVRGFNLGQRNMIQQAVICA
jgi:hypothetical protein